MSLLIDSHHRLSPPPARPPVPAAEIAALQVERGVALVDVLQALHPFVFRVAMPAPVRAELVVQLAAAEHRLSAGTSERLQLGAVCGAFAAAKSGIVAAAV